jgi:hypothetical protein
MSAPASADAKNLKIAVITPFHKTAPEPNHIESMVAAHTASKATLIFCRRIFRHLDGAVLDVTEPPEDDFRHVDSSCWLILRATFPVLDAWRVPKNAAFIGDRIFFQHALRARYPIVSTSLRTVNYRTKFPMHYLKAGIPIPPGAHSQGKMRAAYQALAKPDRIAALTEAISFYPNFY